MRLVLVQADVRGVANTRHAAIGADDQLRRRAVRSAIMRISHRRRRAGHDFRHVDSAQRRRAGSRRFLEQDLTVVRVADAKWSLHVGHERVELHRACFGVRRSAALVIRHMAQNMVRAGLHQDPGGAALPRCPSEPTAGHAVFINHRLPSRRTLLPARAIKTLRGAADARSDDDQIVVFFPFSGSSKS
jgi:hypothetical protein